MRSMLRPLIWIAISATSPLLFLDVAFCWNGSLEEFPTEEHQDKIRTGTIAIGVVLALPKPR